MEKEHNENWKFALGFHIPSFFFLFYGFFFHYYFSLLRVFADEQVLSLFPLCMCVRVCVVSCLLCNSIVSNIISGLDNVFCGEGDQKEMLFSI